MSGYANIVSGNLLYAQEDVCPGFVVSANSTKINLLLTICSSTELQESDENFHYSRSNIHED